MSQPAVEIVSGITPAAADELVAHMRQADIDECLAMGMTDIRAAVAESVEASVISWTATVDGRVACIFGVTPVTVLGSEGIPWMVGTPLISKHARAFIRMSPLYIAQMLRAYPHLANYVHSRNRQAVAWLKRMGFTIREAVEASTGEMFHPFEMRG
jgi:hypothetical protein